MLHLSIPSQGAARLVGMMVLELDCGPCLVVVAVFVGGGGAVGTVVGLLRRIAFVGYIVVGVAVVRRYGAGAVVVWVADTIVVWVVPVWVVPGEVVVAVAAVVGTVVYSVVEFVAVAAIVAVAVAVAVAAALGVLGVVEFEALGDEFAALVVVSAVVVPPKTFVAVAVQRFGAH